jgi:hypothetical protein
MQVKTNVSLNFELSFKITEEEAKALKALTIYGHDDFIRAFYKQLGTTYLQPYERGLRSLLTSIDKQVPALLEDVKAARELLTTLERGSP